MLKTFPFHIFAVDMLPITKTNPRMDRENANIYLFPTSSLQVCTHKTHADLYNILEEKRTGCI